MNAVFSRSLVFLLFAAALAVLPVASTPAADMRVGVPGNVFARLVQKQPAGIVAETLAATLAPQPGWVTLAADDGERALAADDVAVLAAVIPGKRLAGQAWYSAPVLTEYNVILSRRDDTADYTRIADLRGRRIAGRVGYRYPLLEADNAVRLTRYRSNGEMIRALLMGREDLVVISAVSDIFAFRAEGIMSRLRIHDTAIGSVPLVVAFSKRHYTEADVEAFNRRLADFRQSPQWSAILDRNGMSDLVREWPMVPADPKP